MKKLDWNNMPPVGTKVRFLGFTNPMHSHWGFTKGYVYEIIEDQYGCKGPSNDSGEVPSRNYGFDFEIISEPKQWYRGVEYECNGEKPDLPGEVMVEVDFGGRGSVSVYVWRGIKSFHITDERYPLPPENDGHERGELPPVGTECEYLWHEGKEWRVGVVVAHYENEAVVCDKNDNAAERVSMQFIRPIQSEEDKLIERACSIVPEEWNLNIGCSAAMKATVVAMVKAGWRPPE